jgi:hypothetical protein
MNHCLAILRLLSPSNLIYSDIPEHPLYFRINRELFPQSAFKSNFPRSFYSLRICSESDFASHSNPKGKQQKSDRTSEVRGMPSFQNIQQFQPWFLVFLRFTLTIS